MRYDIKKDFKHLSAIGIQTEGLNLEVIYNHNLYDFFIGRDETSKYVDVELKLTSDYCVDDKEVTIVYGEAFGRILTTYDNVTGKKLNFAEVVDAFDQDTYNCLSVFLDEQLRYDEALDFSQLFYLDRISITEGFRGLGLGSIFVEFLKYTFADITTAIVLQAKAFEKREESDAVVQNTSEKLCGFYKKHGFEHYKDHTWVYYEC